MKFKIIITIGEEGLEEDTEGSNFIWDALCHLKTI